LVGADLGAAKQYGFFDVKVKPGIKHCDVYFNEDAQILILKDV
jgi:hypothetical protein